MMIDWGNFSDFFSTGIPSVVFYPSLLVTAMLLLLGVFWNQVKNKMNYSLWVLLLEYVFIVICSTIICRDTINLEFDRLELTPFWTYNAVIEHKTGVSVWDIVLNIVLFLPLGFLVKLLKPTISLFWMMGIAVCLSVFIESSQYYFENGVVQFDDVMHNVIGATIGWVMSVLIFRMKRR